MWGKKGVHGHKGNFSKSNKSFGNKFGDRVENGIRKGVRDGIVGSTAGITSGIVSGGFVALVAGIGLWEAKMARLNSTGEISSKSKNVTLVLCICGGIFGLHRFYVGKIITGILYFVTIGFCGIAPLIDLGYILSGYYSDGCGLPVRNPWGEDGMLGDFINNYYIPRGLNYIDFSKQERNKDQYKAARILCIALYVISVIWVIVLILTGFGIVLIPILALAVFFAIFAQTKFSTGWMTASLIMSILSLNFLGALVSVFCLQCMNKVKKRYIVYTEPDFNYANQREKY